MGAELDEIIGALRHDHASEVSRYAPEFLASCIRKRMSAMGDESFEEYSERLLRDRPEGAVLVQSLSITYSRFFRNPLTFAYLEQVVLPDLVTAHRKSGAGAPRIWSAACAAGQEAYSAAILLDHLGGAPEEGRRPGFRVLGTDLCAEQVAAGVRASYDAAAVANVPMKYCREYLVAQGERYRVVQRLRDLVEFSVYDLLDDRSSVPPCSIYGDFDLVFCCNALLYYGAEARYQILNKVCRAVAPGGYLVVGETESELLSQMDGIAPVLFSGGVFRVGVEGGE